MLERINLIVEMLSHWGARFASLIMIYAACHIILEAFLRYAADMQTLVLNEFIGYAIAAMTFLSMAHTLTSDNHIRISLISKQLPLAVRRVIELACVASGLLVWSGVTWFIGRTVIRNYHNEIVSETIARTPLWIPQLAVLVGLALLLLALLNRGAQTIFRSEFDPAGGENDHH